MLLILHFGDRVSCDSEWPQISYVADDGFEPTTLWHPLPECWDCRCFKWKSFITEAVTFLQPSKPKHPLSEVFCGCAQCHRFDFETSLPAQTENLVEFHPWCIQLILLSS